MKIGLISDTHGHLPIEIFKIFAEVDLIIHAGDIGPEEILMDLKTIAPVKAVFGNMDHSPLSHSLNRVDFIKADSLMLCVTHIMNSPKRFAYELFKMNKKADVVIYGHTHIAQVSEYNKIKFVNPGSVVQPRGGTAPSVAVLTVEGGDANVEFFELKMT